VSRHSLRQTFGEDADLYDRVRPPIRPNYPTIEVVVADFDT
jgi:hypothetical protein